MKRSVPTLPGLALALVVVLSACSSAEEPQTPSGDPLKVRFGASTECMSSLANAAQGGGMFKAAGLDVEFESFESAQDVAFALAAGELDAGTVADTPIVTETLEGSDLEIIVTIARYDNDIVCVARKGDGLATPEDLRGRRVATREGTAAHFFLHSLLTRHGMTEDDVELVFGEFDVITQQLIDGEVDAIAVRPPHIARAQQGLGDEALVFEEPGLYEKTMNLVVTPEVDLEIRKRLVRAMIAAEERYSPQPRADMRAIVAETLGVEEAQLCESMGLVEFEVTLAQSLVLTLEDQARWARESGLVNGEGSSDFLGIIDTTPLDAIDPERITIIR